MSADGLVKRGSSRIARTVFPRVCPGFGDISEVETTASGWIERVANGAVLLHGEFHGAFCLTRIYTLAVEVVSQPNGCKCVREHLSTTPSHNHFGSGYAELIGL
jgi:hypothetical protein